MLRLVLLLDRIYPQAFLAIALAATVAWVGALTYGLLVLVW